MCEYTIRIHMHIHVRCTYTVYYTHTERYWTSSDTIELRCFCEFWKLRQSFRFHSHSITSGILDSVNLIKMIVFRMIYMPLLLDMHNDFHMWAEHSDLLWFLLFDAAVAADAVCWCVSIIVVVVVYFIRHNGGHTCNGNRHQNFK